MNGNTHLKKAHPAIIPASSSATSSENTGPTASINRKKKARGVESMVAISKKAKSEEFASQLVSFLSSRNLPLSLVEDSGFCDLLNTANQLPSGTVKLVGRDKAERLLVCNFGKFIKLVQHKIESAKSYFAHGSRDNSGGKIVTAMHDGRDSTRESFTGVSSSWIDPNTSEYIKIAVGLVPSTSHRSEAFAKQVLEILGRVGIQKADIIASVNDTTNAALKTARLKLASEYGGECWMHVVYLAIEYAMSKRVRKTGKQEVNVFEPGRTVLKEARHVVSHIMDKR